MTDRLPRRLEREPLTEAIFEVRFGGVPTPLHQALLPALFAMYPGELGNVEAMPLSGMHEQVRSNAPQIAELPLLRMGWRGYVLLLSVNRLAIAVVKPYPGWDTFRTAIMDLFQNVFQDQGLAKTVDRSGIRYVNFFARSDPFAGLEEIADINLDMGKMPYDLATLQLSIHIQSGNYTSAVRVIGSAALQENPQAPGSIIDIDSSVTNNDIEVGNYLKAMPEHIDGLRAENKRIFFTLLRQSALDQLGPQYDAFH